MPLCFRSTSRNSPKPSRLDHFLTKASLISVRGKRTQHGKPRRVIRDDQPDAREGQAGRAGVAERLVVPLKPGNAGGGKGPQFKTNATSGGGREIGQPNNSETCSEA